MPLERCLAKTRLTSDGIARGRTVAEHCRIAGAIARSLLSRMFAAWPEGALIFPENSFLGPQLHDIGKVCPTFQKKIYDCLGETSSWPQLKGADKDLETAWGKHAAVSFAALRDRDASENFAWCVGAHHGYDNFTPRSNDSDLFGGESWARSRLDLLDSLKGSADFPLVESLAQKSLVSGLTVIADWIASGDIFSDPDEDWEALIEPSLDKAGFVYPKPLPDLTFDDIFGFGPNAGQELMIDLAADPGVYIFEAPMGSGKTEGALFSAYNLLARGKANGIYFGLPTQLTSNKIHERVDKFLTKILAKPTSAVLAHGEAWLARYRRQEIGGEAEQGGQWFEHGRRAILAPFAAGTVDQALMGAMRVPWAGLRLFGLAGKVVILDEIHSYDAYTSVIIDKLITLLSALGSTVIILSATLASSRRKALVEATGAVAPAPKASYPRLTVTGAGGAAKIFSSAGGRASKIAAKLIEEDDEAIEEILERASLGQQTVWIENTARMAQEIFRRLAARAAQFGAEVGLLHSRFTAHDRALNEGYWTEILGKSGRHGEDRREDRGRILIGTQVIEQSLDIDADFMVSRFAPTDLILQRAGRLWRHDRGARPGNAKREIYLLAPKMDAVRASPEDAFADTGTSAIYSAYTLARSLEVWQNRREISLPYDLDDLIESSCATRQEESGSAMAKAYEKEKRETERKIGAASQSLSVLGSMQDEDAASARLCELEATRILILRDLDLKKGVCVTMDGEAIEIAPARRGVDGRRVAAELAEHTARIPVIYAPEAASKAIQKLLKPYFYEAKAGKMRVILIDRGGGARDAGGASFDNIRYDRRAGYSWS